MSALDCNVVIEGDFPAAAGDRRHCGYLAKAALLALVTLATGCASVLDEAGALTAVPYRIGSSGQIIVETVINDQGPFDFAFDTGASITVIFDDTRETIGLDCDTDQYVTIQGMMATGRFPIAIADRLQVGDEIWVDARLAAMPGDTPASREIDGILGVDFISRYAVSFSGDNRALRLYAPASVQERSYRGWTAIPLRQLQVGAGETGAYAIDLEIGAITIPALLDLGATANIMNWRAARALRVRPLQSKRGDEVSGAMETAPVAAQLDVRDLKTADLRWTHKTFLIADFEVFSVLGFDDRPLAIVGSELFSGRDFLLDFARNRLLVKVPD